MSVYDRPILEYVREHPRATTREIAINIFGKAEHVSHAWKRCDRLKEAGYLVAEAVGCVKGGGFMWLWSATPSVGCCEYCGAPYC